MQVMYKYRDKLWVPLMGPWGAISYASIMVQRQFRSEQFVPMTHRSTRRVTDEVTTGYHTWHDQRVKDVVCPPKNPSKHPINPEPQDVLLESELTRKRLEKEMMNMKQRHEDELEEVKKKMARKVWMALEKRDEWQSKFKEVNVVNSSLVARMQELQSANNALQHEVRRQEQTIQELRNDCGLLETAMEGYKAQYEAVRQEYFQMRERNDSCTQSLQRKEAEMRWILRQMREVAFKARVIKDKTEEHRREILSRDELSERLINHLKMFYGCGFSYDKGKRVAGSSGVTEDVQQTKVNTDPVYPPGFTPPPARNASIPMPSIRQYPFFGMPVPTGPPPTYAQQRPIGGASPSNPISVPDLDDLKEQEKLKCGSVELKDNLDTHQKFDLFKERLHMIEGMGMYCSMDAIELYLVPDVVIPPKFKVLDFKKYDGTKCPVTHITMYCRRMATYAHDDKLLIHCFQDSLTGAAAKWPAVNMMAKDSTHLMKIKPLTIFYEPRGESVEDRTHVQMTIEVPKPFPYKDDKAVLWNYNCNVQVSKAGKWMVESQYNAANITGVGGITHSGRRYTPEALENLKKEKGKEKEQNLREKKMQFQESTDSSKALVTKKEAAEFLKFIKRIENLDYIIENISVGNIISFSDEEIPFGGRGNYKALHITTKCKGCIVAKMLLDNGLSLNVIPMRTLARLPIDMSYMRKSQMIVRAFDGTRREVVGDIEIPIEIGPVVIPSLLHQKVKFIVDGKIVCVNGEEDLLITKPADTPYVEAAEEVLECSFRSFEFVNTTYVEEGTTPPFPRLSKTTKMVVNQIVEKGYRAGAGLRKELQGIKRPIRATKNEERFGLGYKPTKKEREEMITERRRESRKSVSALGEAFSDLSICVTEEDEEQLGNVEGIPTTYLGPPELKLNSWTTMSLPVTCDSISNGFEVNFEKGTSVSELDDTENVEDYDLTPDLLILVEQEGRQIVPHQETLETINLGNEENKKEVRIGFLEVAKYPEWVANIVPMPKKDGKVRICVNYRDLNRVSPKDNFPLPHIDTLVDNTARHSIFSFMDGFSGYNQIKMAPEDKEKTTFITMWGTFCYKVMPFGLKNVGATYQRAMVTLFHDMMHRKVEVYVDDMIVKARKTKDHATNLERLFKRLQKFQLRLNPAKCTFRVTLGKLLGFVVSERGIEVDPDKFKQSVICLLPKRRKNYQRKCNRRFFGEKGGEDYEPMEFEFPDEDLMSICQTNQKESEEKESWKMFFDGASNALGHGIGVVLVSPEEGIIERKIHVLEVYGDSALVIYQLRGEWETRDSKLVRYHKFISKLIENFDKICFTHLPRGENQMADALATLAAMFKVEEEVDGKPWYHDIVHYLKFQQYPEQSSKNDKKTIRRLAMNFFLDGDILYKRSRDQMLLRCVDSAEAWRIVEEVHEGIYFAQKYHKCQIYTDRIHTLANSLNVLTSPWPFSIWGIDVIGLITPKASNGHQFILVAIDYFTKWVEAASYANVTQKVVCKFIQKEIICRYGLPKKIITDNASNLNGSMMKEIYAKFKIKHHNSVPYRPKMNGVVEAANKNIKRIIEKMTDVYKDWHEKLPFALHVYRTTI
ncbi:Uncharacterized protein TCM_035381 [Theobroma cacao]|uniref:Uncharacterized protein n=1 Tax=Theobroma cacao TaxID=3641 RepID=A0A061FIS1_THECC|nr:Uncharacterized protein TCM_035381 [Theobroma cacao]